MFNIENIEITPAAKILPGDASWKISNYETTFNDLLIKHMDILGVYQREFQLTSKLNPLYIHVNKFTGSLETLYENSKIINSLYSHEYLALWEILVKYFQSILISKYENCKNKSNIRYKSYQYDLSIDVLKKFINKIEFDSHVHIKHEYAISSSVSEGKAIDNLISNPENDLNITGVRILRNKLKIKFGDIDMFISNSGIISDIRGAIALALLSLSKNGNAIISIPTISSTSIASLINLFIQCFTNSYLHYSEPSNLLYLIGVKFLGSLNKKQEENLLKYIDLSMANCNLSIFSEYYMNKEIQFIKTLHNVTSELYNNIRRYYKYLLLENRDKPGDTKMIRSIFPDKTNEWCAKYGWIQLNHEC